MLTRLAPTPSGYLHLGNILSFCITTALAEEKQAAVFLRIDDLDQGRVRPAYITDIFQTLHYLGIVWQQGPVNATEFVKKYSQLKRLALYEAALNILRDKKLVYACDCTRKTMAFCRCRQRKLSLDGLHHQWRLITDGASLDASLTDFIIRRKDGFPAYQLSSVVDDVHFGIDLIVRGEDLRPSTVAQLFLCDLIEMPAFRQSTIFHHSLLAEKDGQKMSKSAGAESVHYLAAHGIPAKDIFQKIAQAAKIDATVTDHLSLGRAYLRQFPFASENGK
ncbi:MAG TPA: glutamate--tRNA ligase family protein [Flavihumibacter sp.]|nr:tRNA glutamyl-Q synthetase [Bacteroidota bacterium]HQD09637.1 glutamate--tRNA ligase family protein [Flavihumibacter sp.]